MRRLVSWMLVAFALAGCATTEQDRQYADLAEENRLGFFFPAASFVRSFSDLEEAETFINAAQLKLGKTTGLRPAKGLAARLIGAEVRDDKPVIVAAMVGASGERGNLDLAKVEGGLESALRPAISVSCIFLVFYEGRGVSISRFYLKDGYRYANNSQPDRFTYRDEAYRADYPVGWKVEDAFDYLRRERD